MVTTIQISEKVRDELASLKKNRSYEEIILELLKKHKRQVVAEEMSRYGKEESSLDEHKEWESADATWD